MQFLPVSLQAVPLYLVDAYYNKPVNLPVSQVICVLQGVLTVTLTRCLHLAGKDTYVSFSLFDKEAKRTEIQRSSVVLNDNSPRWGDKFDFVMINANSFLVVTVMEKPGFMESMMTMKFVKVQ